MFNEYTLTQNNMEETDASRIGAETNTTEEQQSTTVEERQNLLETPVRSERRIIVDEEEDEQYSANVENVNLEATQPSDETPNNDSPPMTFYRGRSRTPEEMQQLIQIWKYLSTQIYSHQLGEEMELSFFICYP